MGQASRGGARARTRRREGITLVEAALVASVAGIILAVFVPAFSRALRASKVSEATAQLESLHRHAASYYRRSHRKPSGQRVTRCLPPAAGPAPEEASAARVPVDLGAAGTPGAETWRALGQEGERPLRFRYSFLPARAGCMLRATPGEPLVVLRAEGDLDGDGKRSLFERTSTVDDQGELVPADVLHVVDRVE